MDRSTTTTQPPAPHAAPGAARSAAPPAEKLRARAAEVLWANWTGTSTVPSRALYPHQWSWDSAFIAIGLRHLSPLRAQLELETLLSAQWGDGRVPHIVFNDAVPLDAYFPGPDFWRSATAGRRAGAPAPVQTSGIVQPPVHALAVWLVHRADPGLSRARSFLARLRPRLAAWHRYLLGARDAGGAGLAAVQHPWEQGMDNSPCWDGPLSRVEPAAPGDFRRADLDHGVPEHRPTDTDYGRYVRLAAEYRDRGYVDGAGPGASTDEGPAFSVEDPAFNALLITSEYALALIEAELDGPGGLHGSEGSAARVRCARARSLTETLVARLWDPDREIFLCRDLRTDALLTERGVTGLIPLVLPALPPRVAAALVRTACGPHFGLGGATRLVPSYDLTGPAFDLRRYWRGPAWFNTNWLVERGLRLHGERARADALREAVLDAAGASGFAEYVDPYTGEGCGARGFGWTAALTLDLLHAGRDGTGGGDLRTERCGHE
ncbi:hypothetical protein [Streptomyces sp. WAC 01529]|uniref:MGH1-like glycoside hydrolase domain-containing protein n=1 Tax=Streptomyces sp. WAC 01529 TaxID=2203205 RepID=UPI001F0BA312|nr:hypothetical protein [Streptomyces sp. WAC 01529]